MYVSDAKTLCQYEAIDIGDHSLHSYQHHTTERPLLHPSEMETREVTQVQLLDHSVRGLVDPTSGYPVGLCLGI